MKLLSLDKVLTSIAEIFEEAEANEQELVVPLHIVQLLGPVLREAIDTAAELQRLAALRLGDEDRARAASVTATAAVTGNVVVLRPPGGHS